MQRRRTVRADAAGADPPAPPAGYWTGDWEKRGGRAACVGVIRGALARARGKCSYDNHSAPNLRLLMRPFSLLPCGSAARSRIERLSGSVDRKRERHGEGFLRRRAGRLFCGPRPAYRRRDGRLVLAPELADLQEAPKGHSLVAFWKKISLVQSASNLNLIIFAPSEKAYNANRFYHDRSCRDGNRPPF